jgi:uncharacterized protein (TIGR03435 family)
MLRNTVIVAALAVPSILSQESIAAKPSFSVASVKPAAADARLGVAIQPGGRFIASGAQLKLLIALAYHVTAFQMSGGEGWMVNDRWNIEANSEGVAAVPDWTPPNIPEVMAIRLRSLLEDRFLLKVHRETRMQQAYALTAGKNGPKLIHADPGAATPDAQRPGSFRAGPGVVIGAAVSMEQIVTYLGKLMDRPVIDKTGLTGHFDFKLQFAPERVPRALAASGNGSGPEPQASGDDPSIFTAIEEQLGLRLESTKETAEILVIDSARKPTEN